MAHLQISRQVTPKPRHTASRSSARHWTTKITCKTTSMLSLAALRRPLAGSSSLLRSSPARFQSSKAGSSKPTAASADESSSADPTSKEVLRAEAQSEAHQSLTTVRPPGEAVAAGVVSGAPPEILRRPVRIYQPALVSYMQPQSCMQTLIVLSLWPHAGEHPERESYIVGARRSKQAMSRRLSTLLTPNHHRHHWRIDWGEQITSFGLDEWAS